MVKQYKKGCGYSYTAGFFPTINLIDNKKELVKEIYVSEEALKTEGYKKLMTLVDKNKVIVSSKAVEKLGGKGNDHLINTIKNWINPMTMSS